MGVVPYYVVMGFGIVLALLGVFLFARMGPHGSNLIKLLGFQFKLSGSALVIFVFGCIMVILPLTHIPLGDSISDSLRATGPLDKTDASTPIRADYDTADRELQLSGEWFVTNTVLDTSYNPYRNLRIGYRVFVHHRGAEFYATGEKWSENGAELPSTAHASIDIKGTVKDGKIIATCTEEGLRRKTSGSFYLDILGNGTLTGRFTSTAADSKGTSAWRKKE